jgi:hypothetical protein
MNGLKQYAFVVERVTSKGTQRTIEVVFSMHLNGAIRKWYQNKSSGTIVGLAEV